MEIENVGGTTANSVNAVVALMIGDTPRTLPVRRPRASRPADDVLRMGDHSPKPDVRRRVERERPQVEPDQRQAQLASPKADKAAKALHTSRCLGSQHGGLSRRVPRLPGVAGLRRVVGVKRLPQRKPIRGYAHDGTPEVVDWQISWALEHGISFFIYDWY